MKHLAKAFKSTVALEGQATGVKSANETEIVMYARITDFEGLKKASSKQSQEQWQVNGPFGKIRVRNEAHEGVDGTYTMTIKSKDSMLGGPETGMGIDQTVFSAFKVISDNGMIKDRYKFPAQRVMMRDSSGRHNVPIPDLVFEVDVFKKPDGTYHEWCKIDLEIDSILEAVKNINGSITTADLSINVSDLPFRPMEVMDNTMKDQAVRDKITQLYETVFLTRRTSEQAGGPPAAAGAPDPEIKPTQIAEPEPAAPATPAPTEPAVPDTAGELTGVDNPTPTETPEAPTLEEPDAVAPVVEEPPPVAPAAEPKAPDAPVPPVPAPEETGQEKPVPTAALEEPADQPATGDAPAAEPTDDKTPATDSPEVKDEPPKEETPKEDKPADPPAEPQEPQTPDVPVEEPAAEPVPDTPPVDTAPDAPKEEAPVDPDTVVEAGGDPATPPEGLTEDKVRLMIREEIAAGFKALNNQTPT